MRLAPKVIIIALAAAACGACSSAAVTGQAPPPVPVTDTRAVESDSLGVSMTVDDVRFEPPEIVLETGGTVALTLLNRGRERHGIRIGLPAGPVELDAPLAPGQSDTIFFEVPAAPGEYPYSCQVYPVIRGRIVVRPRLLPPGDSLPR